MGISPEVSQHSIWSCGPVTRLLEAGEVISGLCQEKVTSGFIAHPSCH